MVRRIHDANYRFSLELARLSAQRIIEDPSRIDAALALIERWRKQRGGHIPAISEWKRIIQTHTPQEIAALLVEETDEGQRLRSSHPFKRLPFFTEEERVSILKAAHVETAHAN